jgi:hypothetical protein
MPFNIAVFREHLSNANSHYARFWQSSVTPLETLLARLGATVGTLTLNQIQPLWATVPHGKQLKYAAASAYLKTFVPALVDAIPTSPTMQYVEFRVLRGNFGAEPNFPARYYHVHRLRWQSSNGNLASLANVQTRERVVHRTSPTAPPFNSVFNAGIPIQFTSGGGAADSGSNTDDHSVGNPCWSIARPIGTGSLIADQTYEYSTDHGATWQPIPGATYQLEKGVRRLGDGGHVFYFIKRSGPGATHRFHFEVEYRIVAAPAPMTRIPVHAAAFMPIEDISRHGRLIRRG